MMRALCKICLAAAIVALAVAPVLSQGRGGRGGFGGGMGSPQGLLTNPGVQKELKLTADQITKVTEASTSIREKHADDFAALRDLSQEERIEKMRELTKTTTAEFMKEIEGVLMPEQSKRLKELSLQIRGPSAFSDEELVKSLKLTDDQKDKIKTINEDFAKERTELFSGGPGPETMTKFATLQKETMEKAVAVLTDDQKKTWKDLTGEPFKFEMQFGRGRGGRRGNAKDKTDKAF